MDKEALRRLARSIDRILGIEKGLNESHIAPEDSSHLNANHGDVEKAGVLGKAVAFSDLNRGQLAQLSRLAEELHYKPGDFVFLEGDRLDHFYVVAEGRLKILKHSPSGRDFIFAFSGPGEMLGNVSLFSGKPHPSSVQAVMETRVLAVRNTDLLSFLSRDTESGFKVLKRLLIIAGIRNMTASRRLADLAAERADRRLAYTIYTLSLEFGDTLAFTREEVAQMAGTTTETAIRFVNRLNQEGVVRRLRRKLIILDQKKLELLVGESPTSDSPDIAVFSTITIPRVDCVNQPHFPH